MPTDAYLVSNLGLGLGLCDIMDGFLLLPIHNILRCHLSFLFIFFSAYFGLVVGRCDVPVRGWELRSAMIVFFLLDENSVHVYCHIHTPNPILFVCMLLYAVRVTSQPRKFVSLECVVIALDLRKISLLGGDCDIACVCLLAYVGELLFLRRQ
ncbi:hypothetical protein F4805DRAFT_417532 [Annulohypoxylon moriforme]|nr:hypothetical protein F4805DRAFT_417532 [Annulohypoxylon moriforme]